MRTNSKMRRTAAAAATTAAVALIGVAAAPTADASVNGSYWWGKSTWYSQSEVKKLAPSFRLMTDKVSTVNGAGFGTSCAALGIAVAPVGLACGALVAGGVGWMQVQASDFDYAANRGMCVQIVKPNVGLYDVKPYKCDWK